MTFSEMLKNQLLSADSTQITDINNQPQIDLQDAKRVINGSAAITERSIFMMLKRPNSSLLGTGK
jgi:hypothetical protein